MGKLPRGQAWESFPWFQSSCKTWDFEMSLVVLRNRDTLITDITVVQLAITLFLQRINIMKARFMQALSDCKRDSFKAL